MRFKKIHIRNFKSLVDFELGDPKPFCAFVGPNASGKSNIFEALEFTNYLTRYLFDAPSSFGGEKSIYSFNPRKISNIKIDDITTSDLLLSLYYEFMDGIVMDSFLSFTDESEHQVGKLASIMNPSHLFNGIEPLATVSIRNLNLRAPFIRNWEKAGNRYENDYEGFVDHFSRIFIGKKFPGKSVLSNGKLAQDASNLAQVIGKIFENGVKKTDFVEWLKILIPEFKGIEVKNSNIDGKYDFFIIERSSSKPFPRNLISDGTYNILSLMAAVYQNDEPQFLCIEEPENGLHPQAIELLVDFFREKCEEKGHHIWINTHSQTLVRCLEIDEIILVNKINGETKAKQLTKDEGINIKTDEAWLSNALGGGVLWSK